MQLEQFPEGNLHAKFLELPENIGFQPENWDPEEFATEAEAVGFLLDRLGTGRDPHMPGYNEKLIKYWQRIAAEYMETMEDEEQIERLRKVLHTE